MDYNDNDYEGHNLHLAGEESSKITSVLRPFSLPKFDFDDSLHGHLRYDSLVDNEVFLGISSQDDNQWIEDFSRGSIGIGFSSSATESCALPRHNNVWSEATSSESVEMLLKAVGQEEMVLGENMIEISDPRDQLGSSTGQMETNLRPDDKIDDVDNVNSSLPPAKVEEEFYMLNRSAEVEGVDTEFSLQAQEKTIQLGSSTGKTETDMEQDDSIDDVDDVNSSLTPAEVEEDFSSLNQIAGVKDVRTEYTLHAQEKINSSYGVCVDDKENSVNLNTGMKCKTRDSVNDSLSEKVQENLHHLDMEIDNIEISSQKHVLEFGDQDKVSDISFVSSSCIVEGISEGVEERKEGLDTNDERLGGNSVETVHSDMHSSLKIPSEMGSSKEEHAVEIRVTIFGESSSMPEKGESVSTVDGCSEVAFVVEPAGGSECGTVIFSSGTGIDQPSESSSMLHEKSSVSLKGEICAEGLGSKGNDAVTPQVPVTQPFNLTKSPAGEDVCIGTSISLEASRASFESSLLGEVLLNPSEQDKGSTATHADGPGNPIDSSFPGECCGGESAIDDMRDIGGATMIQKENIEDGDHASPPLLAASTKCREDIVPMQEVVHEGEVDVSTCQKDENKLPFGSSNMVCDDYEKKGFIFSGEVVKINVERSTESQSNTSAVDYRILDTVVEDTKPASSCAEVDEIDDCQNKTELEAATELSTLISNESLEVAVAVAPAMEIEKVVLLESDAAGGTKPSYQAISLVEISNATMTVKDSKELSEKIGHPGSDSIVQNYCSEAAPIEKPLEADIERTIEKKSSIVSVSSSAVEIDGFNQLSAPVVCCTDLSQIQINKKESFERDSIENVGRVLSKSMNSGVDALTKEEGTFTFDIRPLGRQSTEDSDKGLQSFPRIQACTPSLTGEVSPSTSSISQKDTVIVEEIFHGSSLMPSGGGSPSVGVKGPSDRKTRRSCDKSGKESAKKRNLVKKTTLSQKTERGDTSSMPLSQLGAGQLITFESTVTPRGNVSVPTSSLQDLNTSAPSAFFQQPFTDSQQMQLRSQIFVYGSLMQGGAPDETCMFSAFDGGRSIWEPSWRACAERLNCQKNQGNITGTPLQSRSGAKAPDQTSRHGYSQSEVYSSPAGRASNMFIPSPVGNPIIPLSSPLWNISTPSCEVVPTSCVARCAVFDYRAVSPLHPYQTPPIQNFVARTPSWPLQASFPVPWHASSQSSPPFPITEPLNLTPVKESSLPISSGGKHVPLVPAIHTGTDTMFAGTPGTSFLDLKKVAVSTGQASVGTKSRKRKKYTGAEDVVNVPVTVSLVESVSAPAVSNYLPKKVPAVENLSQFSSISRNQADLMSTPVVSCHYSTSVAVKSPPRFIPKGTSDQFFSAVSSSVSSDHLNRGDLSADNRALNLESFSKIEEAKLQAEEASGYAAAAIGHCEDVWSKLDQQKKSGLTSDAEAKLASAAVAIAAAASVAKAAAAAAKIASCAAVQAKQMADEAVNQHEIVHTTEYNRTFVSNSMRNMVNATPESIFKGGDRNNASTLALSAAREAARKRVEAASAATKHAENLDAIVKAAGLAAEAVSHTGKIVGMGDPFSLEVLVEAGPDGYWKVSHMVSVSGFKPNDKEKNKSTDGNVEKLPDVLMNLHEGPDKDVHASGPVVPPIQREASGHIVADHVTAEDLRTSVEHGENNLKPQKEIDSIEAVGFVSESNIGLRSNSYTPNSYDSPASIREGSVVEVLKECSDIKKSWFSANVLRLKDAEALVCYTELQSDEGTEQLKEWVSLEAHGGKAPTVRIPHPMTAVQFEGARKRCRAAVKDYIWSVGDKVDAWVKDCWREGIIAEKNKNDTTTLAVNFPAQRETLMVKVWHLRPTVIWSDGQWIEWCRPGEDGTSEGDTPVEKRPKLGSAGIETKGKGKMANHIDFVEVGTTEQPKLPLSANQKVFSLGSTRDEPSVVGTIRSGLQKEGSRVVFGVPKPGKKRKFMDVSKHYISDKSTKTTTVPDDSVKLAKFLMPQGSGSRGVKTNLKLALMEKQTAESKPKGLRSGKPPSIPSRTAPKKYDSVSSQPNASYAISNDDNESGEQKLAELGSSSNVEETSGSTMVFSSQALPLESRKKAPTRNTKFERVNKWKPAASSRKLAKAESNNKLIPEVAEPRRSNRRIQPTSRLLEGLQSSLIISKIPSSSHDKSHRSHGTGSSRCNTDSI